MAPVSSISIPLSLVTEYITYSDEFVGTFGTVVDEYPSSGFVNPGGTFYVETVEIWTTYINDEGYGVATVYPALVDAEHTAGPLDDWFFEYTPSESLEVVSTIGLYYYDPTVVTYSEYMVSLYDEETSSSEAVVHTTVYETATSITTVDATAAGREGFETLSTVTTRWPSTTTAQITRMAAPSTSTAPPLIAPGSATDGSYSNAFTETIGESSPSNSMLAVKIAVPVLAFLILTVVLLLLRRRLMKRRAEAGSLSTERNAMPLNAGGALPNWSKTHGSPLHGGRSQSVGPIAAEHAPQLPQVVENQQGLSVDSSVRIVR